MSWRTGPSGKAISSLWDSRWCALAGGISGRGPGRRCSRRHCGCIRRQCREAYHAQHHVDAFCAPRHVVEQAARMRNVNDITSTKRPAGCRHRQNVEPALRVRRDLRTQQRQCLRMNANRLLCSACQCQTFTVLRSISERRTARLEVQARQISEAEEQLTCPCLDMLHACIMSHRIWYPFNSAHGFFSQVLDETGRLLQSQHTQAALSERPLGPFIDLE
ncbi:hypothetical protein SAMN05443245_7510 [Paraburkholderia fungorum]|uniref:Uncharacterized protein n=1 Tax=Paraburkholderia fungorum TaxID=134537 RepID=A0A1H1JXL9_9BURK|nr:hypothetical protein SAMN05443245_7510 [Paraburkholderia fungorum]